MTHKKTCVKHCEQHSFPTRRSSDLPRVRARDKNHSTNDEPSSHRGARHRDALRLLCSPRSPPRFHRPLWADVLHRRSEEHTSELQSRFELVCRPLLEKKKQKERCNV